MSLGHPSNDAQAKPEVTSVFGMIGLEHLLLPVARDARAVVLDFDNHLRDRFAARTAATAADAYVDVPPTARCEAPGVVQQFDQGPFDQVRVREHQQPPGDGPRQPAAAIASGQPGRDGGQVELIVLRRLPGTPEPHSALSGRFEHLDCPGQFAQGAVVASCDDAPDDPHRNLDVGDA